MQTNFQLTESIFFHFQNMRDKKEIIWANTRTREREKLMVISSLYVRDSDKWQAKETINSIERLSSIRFDKGHFDQSIRPREQAKKKNLSFSSCFARQISINQNIKLSRSVNLVFSLSFLFRTNDTNYLISSFVHDKPSFFHIGLYKHWMVETWHNESIAIRLMRLIDY